MNDAAGRFIRPAASVFRVGSTPTGAFSIERCREDQQPVPPGVRCSMSTAEMLFASVTVTTNM